MTETPCKASSTMFTERGVFARVIRVQYPAHTTLMNELGENVSRTAMQRRLENPKFLDTDTECIGATLGGPITDELPVEQYWFLNLRNTVRFDKAIAAATDREIDMFVELSDHPTLQLAVQENLATVADERARVVVGTSTRTADGSRRIHPQSDAGGRARPGLSVGHLGVEIRRPAAAAAAATSPTPR